jgi:hypothetical protein
MVHEIFPAYAAFACTYIGGNAHHRPPPLCLVEKFPRQTGTNSGLHSNRETAIRVLIGQYARLLWRNQLIRDPAPANFSGKQRYDEIEEKEVRDKNA